MRIAVLTLVRDRLEYTQHCFTMLRQMAGCEFDHYVLDQGSYNETRRYLADTAPYYQRLVSLTQNVGISRGLNRLLDILDRPYDVVVKIDNDCELRTPNTLRDIAQLTLESGWLLSPQIKGISPVPTHRQVVFGTHVVDQKYGMGGVFLAATGRFYETFRYSDSNPTWGRDDDEVCREINRRGLGCGWVHGYTAWHYEGTVKQEARYPEYFARKVAEGMPWV